MSSLFQKQIVSFDVTQPPGCCLTACVSGQDGDDDDEDWAEETTEEAQRRRMEEISDHAKNLTLSEDLEKPLEERVNLFYNFVKVRVPD